MNLKALYLWNDILEGMACFIATTLGYRSIFSVMATVLLAIISFQAGELFHSAQRSAAIQQREIEVHSNGEGSMDSPLLLEQEMVTDPSKEVKLGFISGLVPRDKSMAFERLMFRATRGNMFLKQSVVENSIVDPVSGEKVEKNVFVVFYSGERAKNKILKISEAFGANIYPFTEDLSKQYQTMIEVSGRITELKNTVDFGLLTGAICCRQ